MLTTLMMVAVPMAGLAAAEGDTPALKAGLSLQFADIVVPEGATRAALEKAYGRLSLPPLNDFDFVMSDVSFKMARRFTEYSGDISGRMLGALQAAAALLGQASPMADSLAAAFPQYQKPDGHFGAEQDLAAGVKQDRDMPICWGNGRLLLALAERYRLRPDPKLLDVARRIGDYVISTRPYYGKPENFKRVGGVYASGFVTCYPSLIDGLAALAEVSGEVKYADEARFIAHLSLLDRAFEHHHSHGRLTAYRGMLDLDRMSGRAEFTPAIVEDCRKIREGFMLPTGGITETFDRTDIRDEGCTEADWVRVNLFLWRTTADPMYLDMAECVLRNHLLATMFLNGGFGHHQFRVLRDGDNQYPGGGIDPTGADSYWCCSMHGTQVLADVARWGVVELSGMPVVTWISEGQWTFKHDGKEITVRTERRAVTNWKVTVSSPDEMDTAIALHVPGRAKTAIINGRIIEGASDWMSWPCKGTGPVTLDVAFPERIRRAGAYGDKVKEGQPVRLFLGPDLLCLADADVPDGFFAADKVSTIRVSSQPPATDQIPVIVESADGSRRCLTQLTPMCQRPTGGCWYLFNVKQASDEELKKSAPQFKREGIPLEMVFGCDGQWELYLNGRKHASGSAFGGENFMAAGYARRGVNEIAIRARSNKPRPLIIGLIRTAEGMVGTTSTKWSATVCDDSAFKQYLADQTQVTGESVPLKDLGGLGIEPLRYIPGDYLGTAARYIWPDAPNKDAKAWYLVRCQFEIAK
jgi:hypothetical protein